jgi:hypothetical protein
VTGNEVRDLIRALERQDEQADRIKRRHKRRGVPEQPKNEPTTTPKQK